MQMNLIFHPIFLEHDTGEHPESRRRLEAFGKLPATDVPSGEQYLNLVHTNSYIASVKNACRSPGTRLDPDTIVSEKSYEAAVMAVGAAILTSESRNFALVRPPGHHASRDHAAGFCLFNNIAIATQKLVNEGKRVMILDIDGHLGDGTESFFYGTNKVLYCSLHQYPAYPGGGRVEDIGEGEGKGYTVNVPLPPGSGDDIYQRGLEFILDIGQQFAPDVVGVSAGFDAHRLDPLLNLRLTTPTYFEIGAALRERFSSIFAVLEGGYNLEILPKAVANFSAGVNGEAIKYKEERSVSENGNLSSFAFTLATLRKLLTKHWQL